MRRILLAGLFGGLAAFIWGALSWGVLPFQTAKFADIPDEGLIAESLKARLTEQAVYHYPSFPPASASAEEEAAWQRRLQTGPVIPMLVYMPSGTKPLPAALAGEILFDIAAATVAAWLLSLVLPRLAGFAARVGFVASLGILAALATHGSDWNWGMLPARYAVISSLDLAIEWLLVGLVLAWRLAPRDTRHTVELRSRSTVA
ncbi:MAG TPA: hypothetical protein VJ672_08825 [Gemmatimonadaceae bacterium]|nr:hypothetical protein [Gemmatimonadaceae bacterium]